MLQYHLFPKFVKHVNILLIQLQFSIGFQLEQQLKNYHTANDVERFF
jgi:hypothetical protein